MSTVPSTVYRFAGDGTDLLQELARMRRDLALTGAVAKQQGGTFSSFGTAYAAVGKAQRESASSGEKFIANLREQADAIGKTRAELLSLQAAKLGVGKEAAPLIAKVTAETKAVQGLGKTGKLSAMEMQQLGYQLNDFFVQVSSGGSPLTALIQQGSQLSGTFGGVGGAFRAVLSLITPTVIGLGALGVAAGIVGTSAYAGYQQWQELTNAFRLSGNYAGQTGDSFRRLAADVKASTGASATDVEDMLTAIVKTGRFGPESFGAVGKAAVDFSRSTGTSLQDTIGLFSKMSDGVTKWAAEQNRQYHFLNVATFERIRRLEEQGEAEKAYIVASEALSRNLGKQTEQLGFIERAWRAVKEEIGGAVEALKKWGKPETTGESLADLQQRLRLIENGTLAKGLDPAARADVAKDLRERIGLLQSAEMEERKFADQRSSTARTQQEGIEASARIKALRDELDERGKLSRALADFNRDVAQYRAAGGQLSAADEQMLRSKLARKLAIKDEADALLQRIAAARDDLTVKQREIDVGGSLSELEKFRLDISRQLNDANNHYTASTKQRVLAALALYEAESKRFRLASVRAEIEPESDDAKLSTAEFSRLAERDKLMQGAAESLRAFSAAQRRANEDMAFEISLIGKSSLEREKATQLRRIDEAERAEQVRVDKLYQQALESGNFKAQQDLIAHRQEIEETANAARRDLIPAIEARFAAERSGYAGLRNALAKYRDDTLNVAAQIEGALTRTFSVAEDAFVNFVKTGKLQAGQLIETIVEEQARLFYKQNFAQPISESLTGIFKSITGFTAPGVSLDTTKVAEASASTAVTAANTQLSASSLGLSTIFGQLTATAYALANALGAAAASAGAQAGSGLEGLASEALSFFFNARGNVFAGMGPVQMYARGDIFDKPTLFRRYASGGTFAPGIMGEAGPEAVMPLTRTRGGKLGVMAQQAAGVGAGPQITINVKNEAGDVARADAKAKPNGRGGVDIEVQVRRLVRDEIGSDMAQGGPITRAIGRRFGGSGAAGAMREG